MILPQVHPEPWEASPPILPRPRPDFGVRKSRVFPCVFWGGGVEASCRSASGAGLEAPFQNDQVRAWRVTFSPSGAGLEAFSKSGSI